MKSLQMMICAMGLALVGSSAIANPYPTLPSHTSPVPGFLLTAQHRYDPAVQRYLAEQSLRALPLKDGQLFYVYPQSGTDVYAEQMQIRYIEALLDKLPKSATKNEPDPSEALPTR